jgi:hypothetical protein
MGTKSKVNEMNRIIGWIFYIWLLASDASEQLIETVKEHFLGRSSSAEDSRKLYPGDRFNTSPLRAVR